MTVTMTRPPGPSQEAPSPPVKEPAPLARGSAQRAAVITLVLAVIFQPLLHPTGPGNSSPVDLLLVASIVTAAIWLAGTHRKLRAPYFVPVALFVIAGAASGLVSPLPSTALTTLLIDLLLFAWCTTVVNVLTGPRAMRCALVAWSWSGIIWAGIFIASWLGHITPLEGINPAEGNRLMFTFGDPNYASWYWDSTIFVVCAARTPSRRWMRFVGYGVLVWSLALNESNGGVLALCLGVTLMLMVKFYRRRGWAGVLAVGLSAVLAVGLFFTVFPLNSIRQWALSSGQPLLVNSIGRSAQSSTERTLLIQETVQLYQRSDGIIGLGPMSTKPLLAQWLYPYSNEAHNDYLAALSERGTLGLFALLLLCGCVIARAGPVLKRKLSPQMAAAVPVPAAIVAGMLAIGVNSLYEEVLHFRPLWLLFGITAVLGHDALQTHRASRLRRFAALRPASMARSAVVPPARKPLDEGPVQVPLRPSGPYVPAVPTAANLSAAKDHGRLGASKQAVSNLGAQGAALACVSIASLLVARVGGPTVLGYYTLLRILPWLFGVIISCGLPTSTAFFLAGDHGRDPRSRPTIWVMAVAAAGLSAAAWLACAVPFHAVFFKQMPLSLLLVMTISVVTGLFNVTAKACCQGTGDITGANLLIVAEEFWFVPVFVALRLAAGQGEVGLVVTAMVISGAMCTLTAVVRLGIRRFFSGWGKPSARLAGRVAAFGARGQLGNMLWLANLRFDSVLLGALAGPAVLGIYAVASKFAELLRLLPTAVNYVLYPRFARIGKKEATAEFRRMLPISTLSTLILTPFVAVGSYVAIPILYGHAYRAAIAPAEIIIIGLSVEGAAAVASAYLLGIGRPGLQSVGMGVGTVITVTLDLILIPRYGAMGGAITSAITYITTTVLLVLLARSQSRGVNRASVGGLEIGADSAIRRAIDTLVAGVALVIVGPVIAVLAIAVRLTSRGPAFYRQQRVGRGDEPFTMLKLRSMVSGADRAGPLVTSRGDARVTWLGAVLRATKLDELPQLINVLRGDMTLIGPRPEVPRFIPYYGVSERALLNVRPGLTGPGQIFYTQVQQGTVLGDADPEQHYVVCELHPKLAIDLDYLRRRGLRYDLWIIVRTVLLLLRLAKPRPAPVPADDEPTASPVPRSVPAEDEPTASLAPAPLRADDEPTAILVPPRVRVDDEPTAILVPPRVRADDEQTIILDRPAPGC